MLDLITQHLTPETFMAWQYVLATLLVFGIVRAAFAMYRQ